MKKLICITLIASMIFSITACGSKDNKNNESYDSKETSVSYPSADVSEENDLENIAVSSEEQSFGPTESTQSEEDTTSSFEQSAEQITPPPDSVDTPIIKPNTPSESSDSDNDEVLYETIYKAIDYGLDSYYPNLFRCQNFWEKNINRYGTKAYYRVLILIDSKEYYDYKHKYLSDNMHFDPINNYLYYPLLSLADYVESYRWMYEKDAQTIKRLGIDAEMQWAFYTKEDEKRTMDNPDNVFYDYGFVATVRGDVLLNFISTMRSENKYGGTVFWMKEDHNMQELYYEYEGNTDSVYDVYVAEGPGYMQFSRPK